MNEDVEKIKQALTQSAQLKRKLCDTICEKMAIVVSAITSSLEAGGKVLLCGNGGSAADSQHLAAELVVRLSSHITRGPLPALSLVVVVSNSWIISSTLLAFDSTGEQHDTQPILR